MNWGIFAPNIELCHKRALASIINLKENTNYGIDLYNKEVGIELKCRLNSDTHKWVLTEEQYLNYSQENMKLEHPKLLYWAFLLYDLNKNPCDIKKEENLDSLVSNREIWFMKWNWIEKYPISKCQTGNYIYVYKKDFNDEKFMNLPINNFKLNFQIFDEYNYIPF